MEIKFDSFVFGSLVLVLTFLFLSFLSYSSLINSYSNSISVRATDSGTVSLFVGSLPVNETENPSGGSGGGGGGSISPIETVVEDLSLSYQGKNFSELNLQIIAGLKDTKQFKLKNNLDEEVNIKLSLSPSLTEVLQLEYNEVNLAPGEEINLDLNLFSEEFGIFSGKILISSLTETKEIFLVLNFISEEKLFDIFLNIPEKYRTIMQGENIEALISIVQISSTDKVDLDITYIIKDFNGQTLFSEQESVSVGDSYNFVKEYTSSSLVPGEYLAAIEVVYQSGFATSSHKFTVSESTEKQDSFFVIILTTIFILVILLSVVIYLITKDRRDNEK